MSTLAKEKDVGNRKEKDGKFVGKMAILVMMVFFVWLIQYWVFPIQYCISQEEQMDIVAYYPEVAQNMLTMKNIDSDDRAVWGQWLPDIDGRYRYSLRLFDFLPLKRVIVEVVPQKEVYVGGEPIGILLRTEGVVVVGYANVDHAQGNQSPAEKKGIKPGDVIIRINGESIYSDVKMAEMIHQLGEKKLTATITYLHEDQENTVVVTPLYCQNTKSWRIGLYVKDNIGGIGTLSFIDEEGNYGALGHMVSDSNTGKLLNIHGGKLVQAKVTDIKKGQRGIPGEKVGIFLNDIAIGTVEKNTVTGVFGQLEETYFADKIEEKRLYSVGYYGDIEKGKATILTVVEDEKIEEFEIEIVRISRGNKNGKNMVLKVTDERLLEKTGGIVQGMSGSPIIQDGKLIGAVTHVLVNDPTKGYGILIENMLDTGE